MEYTQLFKPGQTAFKLGKHDSPEFMLSRIRPRVPASSLNLDGYALKSPKLTRSYRVTYGGLIIELPTNTISLLSICKIIHVEPDEINSWLNIARKHLSGEQLRNLGIDKYQWSQRIFLTPSNAILLLSSHPHRELYQEVIDEIRSMIPNTPLPNHVDRRKSRHEPVFGAKLKKVLRLHFSTNIKLETQRRIGDFRVDFVVKHKEKAFVIEFDEEAHQKKASYRVNDRKRNAFFRSQPQYTFIRVRKDEQDIWLDLISQTKILQSYEQFVKSLLLSANIANQHGRIKVTAGSLKEAIKQKPHLALLLKLKGQPLKSVRKLLDDRLKIPYKQPQKGDYIVLSRSTLNSRCNYQ
ncbi:DUF559 domain-containing protein [Providencia stuartii]|uniref:DUF559 domain-containing protein n=1 Tax=Providencia stuartii TaxID=588 RepID=UPI0012B6026B|nr:DUF559 domain-containing protein [Providencia stuartii]MTC20289.1 DUF559 domain-containing protein [Providencia stuartii]